MGVSVSSPVGFAAAAGIMVAATPSTLAFTPISSRPSVAKASEKLYSSSSEEEPVLNRYSRLLTQSKARGASQAMLYAMTMDEQVQIDPADGADDDKLPDALASPLPKKQKNDPDSWNVETSPFDVVKYFAREGITDEAIKKQLILYHITTLESLNRKMFNLLDVINKDVGGEIFSKINAAMDRTTMKPEEVLGGKVEVDTTCITEASLCLYTRGAVSINGNHFPPTGHYERCAMYTLVMGPSGSGKTMYSLECLPESVYPGAISANQSFRIHLTASKLLGDSPDPAFDLPGQVVKHVTEIVARWLSAPVGNRVIPINLFLFVIIDDAGGTPYSTFFEHSGKIDAIAGALKYMDRGYKFKKGVHVILTGTCLQTEDRDLCSSLPGPAKIRMQPWSVHNFSVMLRTMNREDEHLVEMMVKRFPVLSSLTTNARCAHFVASLLPKLSSAPVPRRVYGYVEPDLSSIMEQRWDSYVDVVVTNVARSYAQSIGLGEYATMDHKFIVAQEAFKILDKAMTDVFLPTFDHITDEHLRFVTQSLLDIDVVIYSGKPILVDEKRYSVSMTPAIAIVLTELLCEKAALSWNWQGLETTAALGEWKRMITRMDVSDFTASACAGIMYMPSPVPKDSAEGGFTLPVVSRSTVLLNGPGASYANVMAPFRLVQVKCASVTNGAKQQEDQILDLECEMSYMGLTTARTFELQQAMTSVLYVMWQQEPRTISSDDSKNKGIYVETKLDDYEKKRCEHFPFQSSLPGFVKPDAPRTASFVLEKNKSKRSPRHLLSPDNGDPEATALLGLKPILVLEEFTTEMPPVTAVFVTNCKRFALTDSNDKTVETIAKADVDWQGKLKSKILPECLVSNLRKNVEIAFLFY